MKKLKQISPDLSKKTIQKLQKLRTKKRMVIDKGKKVIIH